jgi:hypothetical protein
LSGPETREKRPRSPPPRRASAGTTCSCPRPRPRRGAGHRAPADVDLVAASVRVARPNSGEEALAGRTALVTGRRRTTSLVLPPNTRLRQSGPRGPAGPRGPECPMFGVAPDVGADRAPRVADAELRGVFLGDPILVPLGVVGRDAADEGDVAAGNPRSAGPGPPAPRDREAMPVPADHGGGRDEDEVTRPVGPEPAQHESEDPAAGSEPGPSTGAAVVHGGLLPERVVLEREGGTGHHHRLRLREALRGLAEILHGQHRVALPTVVPATRPA